MAQLTAPKAKLQVNEWNHVAFTLDVEKKRVELWVNKMNVASTAVDESLLPIFTNSTNLLLGSDGTSKFDGSMDDIVIYERTVTDSELNSIMHNRNPELYLKSQLESYITFDSFRTNLDAGGIQIDSDVVVQGDNVNDFSNKSLRIQSSNLEPISKSNDGMSTDNMSVGCWIKPLTVDAEDVEIVSKASAFSLGVKQGGEVTFSLGDVDSSDNRFLIEKEYRDLQIANTGSLRVPATTAARAQVTLSSGSYFANEFTVSMWFKVDEYSTTRTLVSGMGFSDDNKALCVEDGMLYMYDASNAIIAQVENIQTDTWYHLVFTDTSLILNYRKYDYLHTPVWSSNDILKLGNNFSNNKNFLGHIDEFVLYQKRLDFLSVFDLFRGIYPKEYESMVVVKYEFDDYATPGKDSSASQKDLTLTTATRESVPAFEFKTTHAPYKGKDGIVRTHYDFVNEVRDTSGNENEPLSKTAISFVKSFNNVSYRAAEFDGTSSKIDCKPDTLKDLDDGFTASTWIQLPEVLTPNTRYPIFAQEGVMMAWLQTDASLNLSSKVYISPKTDFTIKEAVWNTDTVDVIMSIKSVSVDRIYYAALMLKKLDLSVPEDVQALNNAFVQMGVAPQSNTTTEFTFSLTEATGIDGTNYPVSLIDNAYLYMRVVGDVYDLSSAKNVTVYQNEVPMFDSSVYNFVYTTTGPLHNFEALSMTNSSVTYLTDTVFSEEKYVAEYTGKSTHNVTFTPQNDFVLDVVFKQTRAGTEERHGVLELVTTAGTALLYVAHADYWRFNYVPASGSVAATELYTEGATTGMYPAFNEWGRHTYVFRKQTGQVEFYYNGVKGNVVAENAQDIIVEGTTNVFTMGTFNPFDVANTLKIGYANTGPQTDGTRIASMDVILDDNAFPEFATAAEVKDQTYTPTYTLSFASGTEANSFPIKSGSAQVFEIVPPTPPPFFETATRSLDMSFEEYAINNVDIGSTGVTLNGTTHASSGVGKVQTDENGFNYLEMGTSGKVTLPAYTDTASSINHTFYFVVRAADATTGIIQRMTGSSGNNFNIHILSNSNTGMVPLQYPVSTTFNPKDSYMFVVLKAKYVSPTVYDMRIQFVAQPDGVYSTVGSDTEVKNVTAMYDYDVGTIFTIGSQHANADNFKFYECGIIDNFVSDAEFDAIVDGLKAKYYAPTNMQNLTPKLPISSDLNELRQEGALVYGLQGPEYGNNVPGAWSQAHMFYNNEWAWNFNTPTWAVLSFPTKVSLQKVLMKMSYGNMLVKLKMYDEDPRGPTASNVPVAPSVYDWEGEFPFNVIHEHIFPTTLEGQYLYIVPVPLTAHQYGGIQSGVQFWGSLQSTEVVSSVTNALVLYDARQPDAIDGTLLKDYSGNNRHGTITGNLQIQDNGFVFNNYTIVHLNGLGNPAGNWRHTISIWIMFDSWPVANYNSPWYIGGVGGNLSSSLAVYTNEEMWWYFWAEHVIYTPSFSSNTWYHLCFVYDENNNKSMYINGILSQTLPSGQHGTAGLNMGANAPLWLGRDVPQNISSTFYGKISHFAVYDGMLTPEEIRGFYLSTMPLSQYNLVGKYTGTDAHTLSFTPPYDYLVDLTVNADTAQKVMELQYGAETVSFNAADPWTLSGSFCEVSLEPWNESDIGVFPSAWANSGTPTTLTVDGSSQTFYGETVNGVTYNVYASSVLISHRDFKGYNVFGKKYDDRTGYATPSVTTADGGWYSYTLDGNPCFVYIHVSEAINLKAYYISTASPEYGADPEQWELDVSNDGETWVRIDTRENQHNNPNRIANTVRRIEVPSYSGFYSWIRFKFIPTASSYVLQSDWRFEATTELMSVANPSATSIALNTMNRFTLVARAATDSMEVYHDGLPAIVTNVSGSTTVTGNSFTLGSDPTAQEVTLVIGGDENGQLLVESCDVVQSTHIITTFADPTYVAEKQWALTYTQQIALNNVTPADTVLGWGKFDNYLKSDGTKLETGIEVEMWKDYFSVPIENVWGTDTWMIIKTIDGKYYGVGFNQYGQMGMPYTEMTSMTDAANVAESYYFKVPVELPHFAGYDIKKMILRRNSTMFLTTEGKLYGMGKGEATHYCHFGTGTNSTQLNTITHLATDKVIKDFHQSGAQTIILTTDNKLFTVGNNNEHGALGNGNLTSTNTFGEVATNITSTETIKQVYTTDGHSASGFFTESGRAFACGWGYANQYHNGQIHPATNTSFVELKFSDGRKIKQFFMTPIRTWMVDENNDIYVGGAHYENTNGWPSGVFGPGGYTSVPTLIDASINDGTDVIDILQQSTTGIVVVRAGGVYSFGKNDDGRLGNGDAVTTTTTTRAYKIADQHPIISFITTGLGPYLLIGYRTMAAIAPTLTDMDKITDVNTIGMGRGVTQEVLMGPAHLSDESTSNTSNSGRITSGEVFDFFKMVNGNVDGGPMIGSLSNGDKVYFTGHVSAGAQLFEPYSTTGGNGLISQGMYTGQDLFGYTMPNVGHRYSGAVMYELGSSSRSKQMLMTGFKYRISHVWGNGFRGDIYVFYRKSESGYDNFSFHEKVEHPSAIGDRATTEDLMFTNPTPAANAFLLVFVSNIAGYWQ